MPGVEVTSRPLFRMVNPFLTWVIIRAKFQLSINSRLWISITQSTLRWSASVNSIAHWISNINKITAWATRLISSITARSQVQLYGNRSTRNRMVVQPCAMKQSISWDGVQLLSIIAITLEEGWQLILTRWTKRCFKIRTLTSRQHLNRLFRSTTAKKSTCSAKWDRKAAKWGRSHNLYHSKPHLSCNLLRVHLAKAGTKINSNSWWGTEVKTTTRWNSSFKVVVTLRSSLFQSSSTPV